jgi:predicted nucleic acid-binding protein
MGQDVLSQRAAWQVYDRTAQDARVAFLSEPARVEPEFRRLTQSSHPATNVWPDAYLAAVASTAGLSVATLDRAFVKMPSVDVACLLSQ